MDSPDGELTYNGVYNEMKGAFSSADEILGRQVKAALYSMTRHMHMSQAEIQNLSQI